MIDTDGELVRVGDDLGGSCKSACAERPSRFVWERIASEEGSDRGIHGYGERVSGKCCGVDPFAFRDRRHGEHLRSAQNLTEALILPEEESPVAAVDEARETDGAEAGPTQFVAGKWWTTQRVAGVGR